MPDRDKALSIADPHQLFRNSLEQASDAVFVLNADNRVIFLNAAAETLYGASRKQVFGMDVDALVQKLPGIAARAHWRGTRPGRRACPAFARRPDPAAGRRAALWLYRGVQYPAPETSRCARYC
ncbi:PAS domain-containing protein [Cupriavidus basilensis]